MRGELRCHVACCTEGSIVKHVEIFPDCTRHLSRINCAGVPFDARRGALLVVCISDILLSVEIHWWLQWWMQGQHELDFRLRLEG